MAYVGLMAFQIQSLCNCEFCDMNTIEQSTQFDCMFFSTFGMNSEETVDSVSIWTFRISLLAFIMNILPEILKLFWCSILKGEYWHVKIFHWGRIWACCAMSIDAILYGHQTSLGLQFSSNYNESFRNL